MEIKDLLASIVTVATANGTEYLEKIMRKMSRMEMVQMNGKFIDYMVMRWRYWAFLESSNVGV